MSQLTDWHSRAAALQRDTRAAIGGERVAAMAATSFATRHPHDDTPVATLPDCGDADVDRAVASARHAFESRAWSGLAPAERAERLCALADQVAEAEALRLANDCRYGLQATVWTRDTAQARRLALRLQAGSVVVNATASPSASNVTGLGAEPVKMSGFGPEGGVGGLLAYTRLRSVVFHLE